MQLSDALPDRGMFRELSRAPRRRDFSLVLGSMKPKTSERPDIGVSRLCEPQALPLSARKEWGAYQPTSRAVAHATASEAVEKAASRSGGSSIS